MSDQNGPDRPDEYAATDGHGPAVVVVTDSSCDLPAAVADELGVVIVPLTIRFGEDEFVDRSELTTAEFWSRCVNSPTLPETAAPAPGQFEQAYRDAAARGATSVLVVSLSSALSATMQSAILAGRTIADDDSVELDVRVVDSHTITLTVSTPAGERLDEPVTLTSRVTGFTGLRQVLTGGFILVLLTWWFTHWRAKRRAESIDDGRERHPTGRKVGSDAL